MTEQFQPIFIDRRTWGARYSPGWSPMPKHVREVNVHHSVTILEGGARAYDGNLDPTDDPCADMRAVERVLHDRGLAPGYSFAFHPSGVILEGAGGNKGAHTGGRNGASYGFVLLGNYDRHSPTFNQLASMGWMVNVLRYAGALHPNLDAIRFAGHGEHKATACPGANMRNIVRAVPQFARGVL